MTLRFALRTAIERFAPHGADLYRSLRQRRAELNARPRPTAEGFLLVGNETMHDGTFEPEERRIIARALRDADVFVDVGANVGYYTCLARAAGATVVAVEPLESNVRALLRGLDANGWTDVEVWPVGVAGESAIVPLYGASTGASLVEGWANISKSWKTSIPVTTLDILLGHRFGGKRMLIKMDIEGAEYPALRGARSLLERVPKPTWLVEISLAVHHPVPNAHFAETFEMFWSAGYTAAIAAAGEEEVRPEDVAEWVRRGDCPGYNWVFRPKS
jgi:FkbM family methyltransferase